MISPLYNNTFREFFNTSPHENGVLTFVIGIVSVLTIYHFLLFFQHKNKTYIYYSTYTFLIFLTYFSFTKNDFLHTLTVPVKHFFNNTHLFWVWTYNLVYFFFAFRFLKFRIHFPKQTRVIYKILAVLFVLAFILFIITIYSNTNTFLTFGYSYVYLPIIVGLSMYGFYLIYNVPEQTRHYILIGSFVLFVSSILATLIVDFNVLTSNKETGYLIFYIAVIIENIFFSLGLGLRQKLIINERDETNRELINKLQENEILKEEVNQQLQEKIDVLSQQINLKEEIEELKLTALRSQMNPHFVFNALNSIKLYIINNDKKNATSYLNKFSKLMRKILEASMVKETSLIEELETTNLYMSIENIRFSSEIDFQIHIASNINIETIKVPPLVLQPFLENSLWHGLSSKKGKKKIWLSVDKIADQYIKITIEDNGIGRVAAAKIKAKKMIDRKSVGIDLTKERLKNFVKGFENGFTLKYSDVKNKENIVSGTKVVLKIPLF